MTVQRGAREELAEALCHVGHVWTGDHGPYWFADALLPVVERIAAQRAADELRNAAEYLHVRRFNADEESDNRWPRGSKREVPSFYRGVVMAEHHLKARARDLEPQPTAVPSCQAPYTAGATTWLCLRGTGHDGLHEDSAGHRW